MKKKLLSFLFSICCILVLPINAFAVNTETEQQQKEQKICQYRKITDFLGKRTSYYKQISR